MALIRQQLNFVGAPTHNMTSSVAVSSFGLGME